MPHPNCEIRACIDDGDNIRSLGVSDEQADFFSVYFNDSEGHGHMVVECATRREAEAFVAGVKVGCDWEALGEAKWLKTTIA